MKRYALWMSASALALCCCNAALAQATPPADDSDRVETVTVTAERRNENLMTTPISASVITGDQLSAKNVLRVEDLQFVAPQVTINNFGQGINFNIRGIGKGEHNTQTRTGVITYRDGTPTFPGYIHEEPYFDVTSIEVLRGPQGTFVGQNATGGAVFVTSANPDLNGGYNGYILANVGNYAEAGAQGAINIPITDTFGARVAFFVDRRDTFADITENGQEYKDMNDLGWAAMRLSLLWKPTERLTVSFKTDWDYLDNGGYPAAPYYETCKNFARPVYPSVPYGCNSAAPVNPHYTGDPLKMTANDRNEGLDKMTRNVLKLDYEFGDGTILRSVSSFQQGSTEYMTDLDGTDYGTMVSAFDVATNSNAKNWLFYDRVSEAIWTQEFNLISPSEQRVTWILGAFAQHDRYNWTKPWQFVIDIPAGNNPHTDPANPTNLAQHYKLQGSTPNAAWAVFGQIGAKLFGGLEAQLGGRWSTARSKNNVDLWQYGTSLYADQMTKSYSFDYKASLNWTVDENNFLYGFFATGYKPGGLNVPVGTTPPYSNPSAFGPERVQSYEVGYKGTWFDGHVRAQVDGYYNTYKNFQVTIGFPEYPNFGYEVNSPNATKMYGLEAELQAVFGKFAFSGGLGWSHSQLGEFWATNPRVPLQGLGAYALACDPVNGPQPPAWWDPAWGYDSCVNLKGHPQTYAPSLTGSLAVEYRFALENGDTLTPRMSYSHTGPQWATLFDNVLLGDRLGVRNLVGAQLEWKHDTWVLTAYGTNLTNVHYVAAMQSNLNFAGPPRQYGIRLLKAW